MALRDVQPEPAFPNLPAGRFGSRPVFLTYPPDGTNRIAVVDQDGQVFILDNERATSTVHTFLDVRNRVSRASNEEGLLGLAFDPHYAQNGFFYLYYSASPPPRRTVLSRFHVSKDANAADPASETVLLEVPQPFPNHKGGMIAFGPDGYLYIGLGDGGSQGDPSNNGQNLGALLGKILRIDTDAPPPGQRYSKIGRAHV
jgi:glucose/arabinose dehydrogenase